MENLPQMIRKILMVVDKKKENYLQNVEITFYGERTFIKLNGISSYY